MSIIFSLMVRYQEMIEKQNKQKCDPLQVLSLNLEKMLANTYLYADIRKTVTFVIFSGILFSAEWSVEGGRQNHWS